MEVHSQHESQTPRNDMNDGVDMALDQQSNNLNLSQSSASSDATSPMTPTFSTRAHGRYPSNSSSLGSSPPIRESLDGFSGKRPLTEVREEPQVERENDFSALTSSCRAEDLLHTDDIARDDDAADYDWVDSPYIYSDFEFIAAKRHRGDDHTDSYSNNALGNRIRTLSRKFTSKKEKHMSSLPNSCRESMIASRSRASSMRQPSITDLRADTHPLPTPSQSIVIEERTEGPSTPPRRSEDNGDAEDEAEHLSRTPLLPPITTILRREEEPIQSPLQSPKVVDSPNSPLDSPAVNHGLPSPPLSTKPSVSSFHHRNIVPSSEIPSMFLANSSDEWAFKLGHANFTVHPEPYAVQDVTADSVQQLKADWDLGKANFSTHLVSTREHYGANSKIYNLTVQKWEGIDAMWKRHYEAAAAAAALQEQIARRSQESQQAAFAASAPSSPAANSVTTVAPLPSAYTAGCEKFPVVRLEDIVGPMEQIKRPEASRPSRKRAFWRFLQGILPESVVFGRAN